MLSELEYLQESILIEKLAAYEFGIYKTAGISDLLGGVAETIKNVVGQNVDISSPSGVAGTMARFMAPSILFRLHPIAGILYLIGNAFGFDITNIYSKIMEALKPKIESGKKITPEEVTQIGKQIVGAEAGGMESEAANKSFYQLLKEAQKSDSLPEIPWLMGDQKAGPIQRIFGELFKARKYGKAKWLLGGFVIWIIKTVLSGAGLLAVTGLVAEKGKELLSGQKPATNEQKQDHQVTQEQHQETQQEEQKQHFQLKPSGRGTKQFLNDSQNLWIINLISSSVEKTLLAWAVDVYPNLSGYHEIIKDNPNFQSTLAKLEANHKTVSSDQLVMPKEFNSAKEVVDTFASSVAAQIEEL